MKFFKPLLIVCLVLAAVAGMIYQGSFADRADAATTNPGPTLAGYQMIVIPISRITTTTTDIYKFKVPWPVQLLHVSHVTNTYTGTVTLDVKNASGTSLLTSAGTVSTVLQEAVLTATTSTLKIADESTISISTAGTGTANDVTVTLGIKRL